MNTTNSVELSLKSKEHGLEMDRYNNMARDIVFRVNNSSRPSNELDLHGLKVREALDITRERLNRFIKNKEPNLIIIVGRGKNSLNGVAKIKPAVIELVTQFRIKATPNKPNQGCVYIEPLPGNEGYDFSWIDGFFKGFLQKLSALFFVSKMDYAALSKLNIKTLRGYLLSYNIPTQGMLEKQDLVRAIQSHKPIPEASEVYFRRHLPPTPDKSSSFFEELTGIGRSDSPSGSSQGSSSSNSGEGWSWDVDKFFSKLFGGDDRQSNSSGRTRQSRSHSQPHPPQQTQPQPYTQPQQQRQSRPAPADYRPQPQDTCIRSASNSNVYTETKQSSADFQYVMDTSTFPTHSGDQRSTNYLSLSASTFTSTKHAKNCTNTKALSSNQRTTGSINP
ncbi:hypothetical protein BGZ54_004997 [Gamsiella multidivaricata]|nr:hypothetical protein BGZ54_004997 [Gamsiella multidivaricata]